MAEGQNFNLPPEVHEALQQIHKQIKKRRGAPKKLLASIVTTIVLTSRQWARLHELAEAWDTSVSDIIRHAVVRYLRDYDSGVLTQYHFLQDAPERNK